MLVFNLVNTLGGFMLEHDDQGRSGQPDRGGDGRRARRGRADRHDGRRRCRRGSTCSAFLLQAFVVSRVFKYIGVRGALFILPIIALGGYTAIALLPVLGVIRVAKILENGTDYSIQNTTRHALFLPTSRDAKYKAKQAIDSFFVRAGDMLQAVVVFIGVQLAFDVRRYAMINLVLIGVWLAVALAIAREHRKLVPVDAGEKAAA